MLILQEKKEILYVTEVVNTHTGRAELWWCNLRATSRSSCFFFLFLTERSPPGRWLGLKGVSREGGEGKSHNWAPLDYFFAPLLRLQFPFFIFLEGSTSSYTYRHGTSAFHRIFRHTIKKPSPKGHLQRWKDLITREGLPTPVEEDTGKQPKRQNTRKPIRG